MKFYLKKLAENKNQTMYFDSDNKNVFYAIYKMCQNFAEAISSEYNGDHIVTTFKFKTGEIVKAWYNDELGIFSKLELI